MTTAPARVTFAVARSGAGGRDLTPRWLAMPPDAGLSMMRALVSAGEPYIGAHERLVPCVLDLAAPGVLGEAEQVESAVVTMLDYDPLAGTYTDVSALLLADVTTAPTSVAWTLGDANAAAGHTYLANVDVRTTTFRVLQLLCGPILCPLVSGYAPLVDLDPGRNN